MRKPTISIVTLTWNSARHVPSMLGTLEHDALTSGIDIEAIVIDNGSDDETLQLVRDFQERHENIQLVPLSRNHGTTVPRNIGIRMARGEYLLILDSDTEIPPGTLAGLLRSIDEIPDDHDRIGIVHPRLVFADGGFQESARRFPTLMTKVYRLLRMEQQRARDESIDAVLAGQLVPVDYAISAAWFVPRQTFDRVGLLDESIFYSPEDVEFCARCWKGGLKVWYYPPVQVVHNCQRITSKKPLSKLGLSHLEGLLRFWWQYDLFFTRPRI